MINRGELLVAIIKGDRSALSTFITIYKEEVINTCIKVLHNREDSEEVAQETFLEAYTKMPGLLHESDLSLALKSIALQKAEAFRRRQRFRDFITRTTRLPETEILDGIPGENLETEDRRLIVLEALDSLPAKQRTAFILHHFEDVSYRQIAITMKTSVSSVESLIFRAMTNLKKRCGDFIRFEESITQNSIQ